jgi:hypothetical protein
LCVRALGAVPLTQPGKVRPSHRSLSPGTAV